MSFFTLTHPFYCFRCVFYHGHQHPFVFSYDQKLDPIIYYFLRKLAFEQLFFYSSPCDTSLATCAAELRPSTAAALPAIMAKRI